MEPDGPPGGALKQADKMAGPVRAEAVWSGVLRLSLISCPVHLVPLSLDAPPVRFDRETSEIIEMAHFIPRDQVDRERLETTYCVCPDGRLAADTLDALRLAMQRAGRDAVGYVRCGRQEIMVLIQPDGGGLTLSAMRRPLRSEPAESGRGRASEIPAEMVEAAEAMIARRVLDQDANALHDRYEERLRASDDEQTDEPAVLPEVSEPPDAVLSAAPPDRLGIDAAGGEDAVRELGTEILLYTPELGDRRFVEPGWAGNPGSRRHIEAISIRPREELEPSAIEFRVFAAEGRATAWVSNGNYAGTRDRQLPLTGFAARPTADLGDRFDVVYEGCFFDGGVVGPKRNGDSCTSPVPDDPLEAVRVSIVERRGAEPK